jgi:hypothetical protein
LVLAARLLRTLPMARPSTADAPSASFFFEMSFMCERFCSGCVPALTTSAISRARARATGSTGSSEALPACDRTKSIAGYSTDSVWEKQGFEGRWRYAGCVGEELDDRERLREGVALASCVSPIETRHLRHL